MSRYLRQDPIEGWHHITNHAVGSEELFLNDTDRYQFLRRMNEASAKHGVIVAAFCLMGNHVHLVLWCPDGGVSDFMHYVESIYAREFNMRHGRRGALFGCEFHNTLITTDGQAMATIRYVHRNPLELGIDIRAYPWSSYRAHLGVDDGPTCIDVSLFTELLGGSIEHRHYVETDFPNDEPKMSQGVRHVYRSAPVQVEQVIIELCHLAAAIWAVSIQEIVAPRTKARNDARLAVVLVAYESRTGFADEIRSLLGYRTASALTSAVQRARARSDSDPVFRELTVKLRMSWANTTRQIAS